MTSEAPAVAVNVIPEQFTMVNFDAGRIAELVAEMADRVGLGGTGARAVTVEVDETIPLARARLMGLDPVHLRIEGGGYEDPKHLRQLSESKVRALSGLLLFQARDRLDPQFGAAPIEDDPPLALQVAGDAYAAGRLDRLGYPMQRPRRLYHFRNRHGFTDAADAAFDHLWTASDLTWPELVAISDRGRSAQ